MALVGGDVGAGAAAASTTTETTATEPSLDITDTSAEPPADDTPDTSTDLGTDTVPDSQLPTPPSSGGGGSSSPPPAPPRPPAPLATVDVNFTGTDQNFSYLMSNSPILSWSTANAVQVRVWEQIDGVRTRVISQSMSSAAFRPPCPGAVSTPGECSQGTGSPYTVTYVIDAYNIEGVITSSSPVGYTFFPSF